MSKASGASTLVEQWSTASISASHAPDARVAWRNGAGKTTTLETLSATLAPSAGRIAIAGIDLLESPRRGEAELDYLPPRPPLRTAMTVLAFLRFAAALRRVSRAWRRVPAGHALERCGLAGLRARSIGRLSRGYRQRVGLAQALV